MVSDPPDTQSGRWPTTDLARLGLGPARSLVERGVHFSWLDKVQVANAELLAQGGQYQRLYELQFADEEEEELAVSSEQ